MEYVLKPKEKFQAQGVLEKTQLYTVTETIVKQNKQTSQCPNKLTGLTTTYKNYVE